MVVFISGVTGHGGPNASLSILLRHLRGIDRVLLGPYGEAEAGAWRQAGVAVRWMPRPLGARRITEAAWILVRDLWRHRRHRPLVFANGLTEAAVVAPALLLLRLQGFVWVHNYEVPRIARALAPLLRRLAGKRLHFAAVSSMAAGVARQVVGTAVEIELLPNPIEQVALRRIERPDDGPSGPLRVAYLAGTDRVYKGFDLLPAILEAADGAGLEWLIVAVEAKQPQAWDRLREAADALTASRVTLRGRSSRMEELYAATDVVLIPSRQESFCRVAAEAMAAGAAVVSSGLPAIREVCGDVAFFFPVEDVAGAAAHLRHLAASRDRVARAAREGRLQAERFTPTEIVARAAALLARATAVE
jgi:glycosyltransferase involved in cell wall biosynthesis